LTDRENSPATRGVLLAGSTLGLFFLATLGWSPHPRVLDSPPAIFGAAFLVLVLPGLALGEFFRSPANHPLQVLADAFFNSLVLTLACGLVGFATGSTIGVVLALMAGVALLSLVFSVLRGRGGLISGLPGLRLSPGEGGWWLLILGLLGAAMYRTADQLSTVGFELSVHLTYVRQYASGLPLDFQAATLRDVPEFFLPNLFFLWEFLLALVSSVARADPLVANLRSRWLIPVLGLACFYSLSREITRNEKKAKTLTSMLALLSLSGFIFLEPGQFAGLPRTEARGIMAFWGSVHHSDAAREILRPLLLAKLLSAIERMAPSRALSLGFAVAASFFWHPREAFQVAWYALMMVLTVALLLVRGRESRLKLRNAALALAVVGVAAGSTAFICRMASPRVAEVGKQLDYKERIWAQPIAAGALKFANPFDPPPHGLADAANPTVATFSFLGATALFLPGVLFLPRSSRRSSLFFVLVRLATLCAGPRGWSRWSSADQDHLPPGGSILVLPLSHGSA
jgi:hypothetical protein